MKNKYFLIDIGELGWSLYVSAYANWLYEQGNSVLVITSPQRFAMYQPNILLQKIPDTFYSLYGKYPQYCFGRYSISPEELTDFSLNYIKNAYSDYTLAPNFKLGYQNRDILKPFYKFKKLNVIPTDIDDRRIVVFPRHRTKQGTEFPNVEERNISEKFYAYLIDILSNEFPLHLITTIGVPEGAYTFNEFSFNSNVCLSVKSSMSINTMLKLLEYSDVTIGGTSAPSKIAMIQGVPSFIIGHEKERFLNEENWMNTKADFYDVGGINNYQNFNEKECVNKIISFCRSTIDENNSRINN